MTDGLTRERVAELDKFKRDLQVNNLVAVREKLDSGLFDANETFPFPRWTPLMIAAHSAHYELVKLLLERGANPNAEVDRYTVLHAAIASHSDDQKSEKCVRLLLDAGATVNALGCLQMTALSYAAKFNKIDTMRTLLEFKAEIDAQCARGYSALMYAASNGHTHATAFLLVSGANPELSALPSDLQHDSRAETTGCDKSGDHVPRRIALQLVEERLSNPNLTDAARERLLETRSILRRCTNSCHQISASTKPTCTGPNAPNGCTSTVTTECASDTPLRTQLQCANATESRRRLAAFLKELNLAHLRALTDGRQVTFAALLSSDDAQLCEQFGVTDASERSKLLTAIQNVHEAAFADDSLPFASRIRRFAARRDRDAGTTAPTGTGTGTGTEPCTNGHQVEDAVRLSKGDRAPSAEVCDTESALSATDLLGVVRNVLVHTELLESALCFVEHQIAAAPTNASDPTGRAVPVFATQRHDDLTVSLLGEALRLTTSNTQSLRATADRLACVFDNFRRTFDLRSPDLLVRVTHLREDENVQSEQSDCSRTKTCNRRLLRGTVYSSCAILAALCIGAVTHYRPHYVLPYVSLLRTVTSPLIKHVRYLARIPL